MKKLLFIFIAVHFFGSIRAQEQLHFVPQIPDSLSAVQNDSIESYVVMPEIFIGTTVAAEKYRRDMTILRNRILRVYPYAKATADNLIILNRNLEKMATGKQKRDYINRSQKYLETEFKERLKKLSRKDGKILVKLIYRQTGSSTFNLIKEFKSGWSAFWSNNTARMFDINLKSEYHPHWDLEDFYIETQLNYLFFNYRLERQEANPPINFNQLRVSWKDRLGDSESYPLELRD